MNISKRSTVIAKLLPYTVSVDLLLQSKCAKSTCIVICPRDHSNICNMLPDMFLFLFCFVNVFCQIHLHISRCLLSLQKEVVCQYIDVISRKFFPLTTASLKTEFYTNFVPVVYIAYLRLCLFRS